MDNWQKFSRYLFTDPKSGLQLDISRVNFEENIFARMEPEMQRIYTRIGELERGAIANPDENRMVGHYWLRNPGIAPTLDIEKSIISAITAIQEFSGKVHQGDLRAQTGGLFKNVLLIGIGGSSLGPRFLSEALKNKDDKISVYFLDNTDPDGIDGILTSLGKGLEETLTLVISKSGGTVETANGLEEVRSYYAGQGLNFAKHAVAITQTGSKLAKIGEKENWLAAFPVWDWVGGRTSVFSPVGLLPLALQGINIRLLLKGAGNCDELTRRPDTGQNPAALLALMWYAVTGGQGGKQMVFLPYKDRLELMGKYLQQLIMESLGKEQDLDGNTVKQGIAVYGNKGSTDQHSYLQQLLEGPENCLVTFVEVLRDRRNSSPIVNHSSTSGDYLHAFFLGTRDALSYKGRDSLTITIPEINESTMGALVALFERAVSIYALLINVNAYHQPAVELGKKAAGGVIELKNQIVDFLEVNPGRWFSLSGLAQGIGKENEMEMIFKVLQHLGNNPDSGIRIGNVAGHAEELETSFQAMRLHS